MGPILSPVMVGYYLWVTLQYHHVIGDFFWTQFHQHPEAYPLITMYLFDKQAPQVDVVDSNRGWGEN